MNRLRAFRHALPGMAFMLPIVLAASPAFADDPAPPKVDSGDTAWMLASTALVLMMTIPGLALFYGGMVRKKNILATLMQSFIICCLVTVIWMVVGYSLAFTNGNAYIGDLSRFFLNGFGDNWDKAFVLGAGTDGAVPQTIPESVYMMFQMTFAIITPALICGAFADRRWRIGCGRPRAGSAAACSACRVLPTSPAARWFTSMRASPASSPAW